MGVVPYLLGDAGNKQVGKSSQVFLLVKVLQHMVTSGAAQPGQRRVGAANGFDLGGKVLQRIRAIKKPGLAVLYQFRNSCDPRGKNDFAVRHCLHQHQRDALAATREHDQVAQLVLEIEFLAGKDGRGVSRAFRGGGFESGVRARDARVLRPQPSIKSQYRVSSARGRHATETRGPSPGAACRPPASSSALFRSLTAKAKSRCATNPLLNAERQSFPLR